MASPAVKLYVEDDQVVMDNGIVQVYLSNPGGFVTRIQYSGIDNLLETRNKSGDRGYWDVVWSVAGSTGTTGTFERIVGTSFSVIVENEKEVEISFTSKWDPSLKGEKAPLNIDKRYVMLSNSSGFYSYSIFEHLQEWPAFNIPQIRTVYKLSKDKFHYMVVSDNRQRFMPLPDDRLPGRGEELVPPEAVLLVNPFEPEFKGEVDDKYQYSSENKDLMVHGWISSQSQTDPFVGFWVIIPSNEFRSGGPVKQNLTSHVGPISLAMFLSAHYAGEDIVLKLQPKEPWKKVFGPTFVYLNTLLDGDDPKVLWEDAKDKTKAEVQSWPYDFPASEDFQKSTQRGSVCGTLLVQDRFLSDEYIVAEGAYIGVAAPGEAGSWQRECKGYQFWSKANEKGYFSIKNIRSGDYNLYAWVPGFIGEYWSNVLLTITPGCEIDVGEIVFEAPRDGPTLWEIGIPDRSAAEFYVPDPNPNYINKLYVHHPDKYRQYGLWERYAELYPNEDLIYTVGVSDYTKDWFFAQVTRKKEDGSYQGTTWQIKFNLDDTEASKIYKLRLALASANVSELQVRVNDPGQDPPLFTTGVIGKDFSIARHGIHGLYWLFNIDVSGFFLEKGVNNLFLTQTVATGPLARFQGIMYDYIRLEGPNPFSAIKEY
ncbi:probable rhamnogalacturonate lyase C [Vigna radiata var. radiata]|uniref:rhamnogalacturonan endolyase n=1 Tax=Vigna radiata var. radiata TaxID=3916 RepID=A0A1S3UBR6_VIGRR|nr:probable rhamnogalacturonate lyase C [Vigna radiata var. radiata]